MCADERRLRVSSPRVARRPAVDGELLLRLLRPELRDRGLDAPRPRSLRPDAVAGAVDDLPAVGGAGGPQRLRPERDRPRAPERPAVVRGRRAPEPAAAAPPR